MRKKAASAQPADSEDSPEALHSCTGSQLELFPWLRNLNNDTSGFDGDEAYFLVTGSFVNNSGKSVYYTVQHALLDQGGFLNQQRYGILNPLPRDGFTKLYNETYLKVTTGLATIPNAALEALPATPVSDNLTENQLVALTA